MHTDRRARRSERRDEALDLALDAAARRADARAAVLADADGFLVAGAGDGDHHLLAALAALALDPRDHAADRLRHPSSPAMRVSTLRVHDVPIVCAALGDRCLDVRDLEAAAARIVATRTGYSAT